MILNKHDWGQPVGRPTTVRLQVFTEQEGILLQANPVAQNLRNPDALLVRRKNSMENRGYICWNFLEGWRSFEKKNLAFFE